MNGLSARYKIPVLMALAIAGLMIVFKVPAHWFNAIWVLGGVLVGVIFVDLEYLIHAYFIDPSSEESQRVRELVSKGKFRDLVNYLNKHEYSFGELSIRSMLFQILLVFFAFYILSARVFVFAQAIVLSVMANLIYIQLIELSRTKSLKRWFWIYNGKMSEQSYQTYVFGMILVLIMLFWFS